MLKKKRVLIPIAPYLTHDKKLYHLAEETIDNLMLCELESGWQEMDLASVIHENLEHAGADVMLLYYEVHSPEICRSVAQKIKESGPELEVIALVVDHEAPGAGAAMERNCAKVGGMAPGEIWSARRYRASVYERQMKKLDGTVFDQKVDFPIQNPEKKPYDLSIIERLCA